jgi:CRP-like cAMP-binding protein
MEPGCFDCPVLKGMVFRGLTSEQVQRLGCVFRPGRYRRGQILFFEGGQAEHVFSLHSGLVKIVKSLENGKERLIRAIFPGELFGLEAFIEPTYPLTAVTLRDSEICAGGRDELLTFLHSNADIALGMIRFLVTEVTRARTEIADMSFKDARMKIATLLLSLMEAEVATPLEAQTLVLPFSRQEISEILELSPETVSRTLGSLRRERVLEARGRRLEIQDVSKLQAAAHR